MSTELATVSSINDEAMWKLIADGDLSKLSDAQKATYYRHLCQSLKLNPATQPFQYITLNGKLRLYALKTATDQLRSIHGVSFEKIETDISNGLLTVTAYAIDKSGRRDVDMGVVTVDKLVGDALANAKMKALTKAKRRVTLSICGLGFLDESEVDSVPGAHSHPHMAPLPPAQTVTQIEERRAKPAPAPDPEPIQDAEIVDLKALKQKVWDRAGEIWGDYELDPEAGEDRLTKQGASDTADALRELCQIELGNANLGDLTAKQCDLLLELMTDAQRVRHYLDTMRDGSDESEEQEPERGLTGDRAHLPEDGDLLSWREKLEQTPVHQWSTLYAEAYDDDRLLNVMIELAPSAGAIRMIERYGKQGGLLTPDRSEKLADAFTEKNTKHRSQATRQSA